MTLQELIDELQDLAHDLGEDTEVRLAVQPNWPLAHEIACVGPAMDEEGDDDFDRVVWIASGSHPYGASPYAPRSAWQNSEVY
jgi:hypothetical protein